MKAKVSLFLIAASLMIFSGWQKEKQNQQPTCIIINPTSGTKFSKDTTITIFVKTEDKDGKIEEVRFFVDEYRFSEQYPI